MKRNRSLAALAFLLACSPADNPAGAQGQSQGAAQGQNPGQPSQTAPQAQAAPAPGTAPGQGTAPQKELSPTDKKLQEAFQKIEAGDGKGALQILEGLRRDNQATPPVLSLLAAVYLQENRPKDSLDILRPMADVQDADPAVLYNAGRAALALNQTEVGQKYLERSVALVPVSPAARELGMLLSRQGRIVEGYRWLRPWALRSPDDLEARVTAASLALRLERPAEVRELLSGLPEKDPGLQLLRGQALVQQGDGKGALALLEPLQKSRPEGMDLEVRRALAEAYLLAGNPAAAVKQLDGRAGQHPGVALVLARSQRQAGNAQAAMATLKPYADKLPAAAGQVGDPRPAAGIAAEYGRLLLAAGQVQQALPMAERATRLYPNGKEGWEVLADALTAAGRTQEAARAREEARKLGDAGDAAAQARQAAAAPAPAAPAAPAPAGAQAQAPPLTPNLAEAMRLMSQNQPQKALEAVRREIQATPDSLRARTLEVQLLLGMQNWQGAHQAAEAALKLAPQNPDMIYQRGATLIALQRLPEAERDLRKTLELAPEHIPAMNDLAVVLTLQNKPAEAQKMLERVLALNPNDPNARASLENLKKGGGAPPAKKGKG